MDNNKSKGIWKWILPWIAILMMFSALMMFTRGNSAQNITYNEFMDYLSTKEMTEMTITPDDDVAKVTGIYVEKVTDSRGNAQEKKTKFYVVIPNTDLEVDSLVKLLSDKNVKFSIVDNSNDGVLLRMLMSVLPYVLLLVVCILSSQK